MILRATAAALAIVTVTACGAYDEVSTEQIPAPACENVESRLQSLQVLVDAGQLAGLADMMRNDLEPDVLKRLIHALLQVAGTIPPGVADALAPLASDGSLDQLLMPLGGALDLIAETPSAHGAMHQLGRMMVQCTGKPLLSQLSITLADPTIRTHLEALTTGDVDLVALLASLGIDLTSLEGRAGFQSLVRNLLIGMAEPSFDVDKYLELLGLIVDTESPEIQTLLGLVSQLLGQGPLLDALNPITQCLLATDADHELVGLLFDLLRAGAIDLIADVNLSAWPGGMTGLLDDLMIPMMDRLAEDDLMRTSLVLAIDVMLRPTTLDKVMPDLASLVNSSVLGDLVALLSDLGDGACQ